MLEIQHNGSALCFTATINRNTTPGTIDICFDDGSKSAIEVEGLRFCMPSCEGTVMAVLRNDGTLSYFDTVTGKELSEKSLRKIPVHFYE